MTTARTCWLLLGGLVLLGAGFLAGSSWSAAHRRGSGAFSPEAGSSAATSTPAAANALAVLGSDPAPPVVRSASPTTPASILTRLAGLKVTSQQPLSTRALLVELERLRQAGAAALPGIREFLATGQDADYETSAARGFRNGAVPVDFTVPPSLRLGLIEVVKNIGGPEAESILLHELQTTGRGVEAAYLGAVLQQLAPDKYRDAALRAASDLLAMPLATRAQNPLDRSDREYLYGMLATAGDQSHVRQAQEQLVLPNGHVDPGALRYLRQILGEQVVAIAARAWQDPQLASSQREPLARMALAYVGMNESADQIYRNAINDPALSANARKDLIEDLNQTGFADPKHLTAADLPLIQRRLALIEELAPSATDRTNAAAFVEARKDLLNMRDKLLATASRKK